MRSTYVYACPTLMDASHRIQQTREDMLPRGLAPPTRRTFLGIGNLFICTVCKRTVGSTRDCIGLILITVNGKYEHLSSHPKLRSRRPSLETQLPYERHRVRCEG